MANSRTPHKHTYYLSHEAAQGVRALAKKHDTVRAINHFIGMLPTDPERWTDRRPKSWKDNDLAMLESGHFPQWSYEFVRMRHEYCLFPHEVKALADLARHFNIRSNNPYYWDNDYSCVSALLEALGTGLLTIKLD